jgi:hypothetical protein
MLVPMMAIFRLLFFSVGTRAMCDCVRVSCCWKRRCDYLLSLRDCARLVHCFDFVFVLGRGAFFFFCQPAEEAALILQDGLSATMEMLLSSVSFLLLLLLICGGIGDKKGVLKVNRAEEEAELSLVWY